MGRKDKMQLAHFGEAPSPKDHGRTVIDKSICDRLRTHWGLIQLACGNPADDFRAYADGRLARCKVLMAASGISNIWPLVQARQGPAATAPRQPTPLARWGRIGVQGQRAAAYVG